MDPGKVQVVEMDKARGNLYFPLWKLEPVNCKMQVAQSKSYDAVCTLQEQCSKLQKAKVMQVTQIKIHDASWTSKKLFSKLLNAKSIK